MSAASSVVHEFGAGHHDRRKGLNPIPLNLREFLSDDQRRSIRQLESFGWRLAFVRRPLFQDTVVVMCNSDSTAFSVVEEDGTVNEQSDLLLRH